MPFLLILVVALLAVLLIPLPAWLSGLGGFAIIALGLMLLWHFTH